MSGSVTVRFGPATAVFEEGALRWISVGGIELLRGVYVAVRDKDWGTTPPVVDWLDLRVGRRSFAADFVVDHRSGDIDVRWRGRIAGSPAGDLVYSMRACARSAFAACRIAICVLHPPTLAGQVVDVRTPAGAIRVRVPVRIAPPLLATDILGLAWTLPCGSGRGFLEFEGDLFEMEDQRNWTDASFKTYSRPLRLPFPFQVGQGERFNQELRFRFHDGASGRAPRRTPLAVPGVEVHRRVGRRRPASGFGMAGSGGTLWPVNVDLLRFLRPAHLRVSLSVADPAWPALLEQASTVARTVDAGLELEVVAAPEDTELVRLAAALSGLHGGTSRVLMFDATRSATTATLLRRFRRAMAGPEPTCRSAGAAERASSRSTPPICRIRRWT